MTKDQKKIEELEKRIAKLELERIVIVEKFITVPSYQFPYFPTYPNNNPNIPLIPFGGPTIFY